MFQILILVVILVLQPWDGGTADEPVNSAAAPSAPNSPPAPVPTAPPAPAPPAPAPPSCPLIAGSSIEMTLPGCLRLFSDTSARPDPEPLWGAIDCEEASRQRSKPTDGDPTPQATGAPQRDEAFRRLRLIDGDDIEGERCELGLNDHEEGPTALYTEGKRRVTFISVRLPRSFPLDMDVFQVVMQMKQTQPSDNGGGTPVLALEAFQNRWRLRQSDSTGPTSDAHELWSAPAQTDVWTRFALDVTYSRDPSIGMVTVYADLNGDGDFDDSGEQSREFRTYTLKVETDDGDDGIDEGASIPSHLRIGLYHDPAYECPEPKGCYLDLDNIQVIAAPSR